MLFIHHHPGIFIPCGQPVVTRQLTSRQSQRRCLARRLRSSLWCQAPSWLIFNVRQERGPMKYLVVVCAGLVWSTIALAVTHAFGLPAVDMVEVIPSFAAAGVITSFVITWLFSDPLCAPNVKTSIGFRSRRSFVQCRFGPRFCLRLARLSASSTAVTICLMGFGYSLLSASSVP